MAEPIITDIVKELPHNTDPKKQYSLRSAAFLKSIVVHHTGGPVQTVESIARQHVAKGWPGIGYHYVIDADAKTWKTNYVSTLSYHAAGSNKESIGVCVVGHFEEKDPSPAQLSALKQLLLTLLTVHPSLHVFGHKDKTPTQCPGRRLYDWLRLNFPQT